MLYQKKFGFVSGCLFVLLRIGFLLLFVRLFPWIAARYRSFCGFESGSEKFGSDCSCRFSFTQGIEEVAVRNLGGGFGRHRDLGW
jgi:hypothetical protein